MTARDVAFSTVLLVLVLGSHLLSHASTPAIMASALVTVTTTVLHFAVYCRMKLKSPADAIVLIFDVLFVVIAPSMQIAYLGGHLVNTSRLDETCAITANLLFALFTGTYTATRYYLNLHRHHDAKVERRLRVLSTSGTVVLIGVCAGACVLALQQISLKLDESVEFTPAYLFERKYVCFLPVSVLFAIVVQRKYHRPGSLLRTLATAIATAAVIVTQNPIIEKRNSLGPIYLGLLFLLYRPFTANHRRLFYVLLLLIGVFFPVSSLFTHQSYYRWGTGDASDVFTEHLFGLHYDAWANVHTVVEIVAKTGLRWGHQLLGTLFFYVPRSLWPTKPTHTGYLIADYLPNMSYTNISAPLVAEAYLDFSVVGVIGAAVLMAYLTRYLDKLYWSKDPIKMSAGLYFSLNLLFLLRGALMSAVAYATGAALAFITVQWMVTPVRRRRNVILHETAGPIRHIE